jgi:hypothetical protein
MHNQNEACIDPADSAQHETAVVNRTDSIDDDSSHTNNDEQLEEQADVMPECVENVQLYEKWIKLFHSVLQATMHDHAHRAPPPLTICKWKFWDKFSGTVWNSILSFICIINNMCPTGWTCLFHIP